MDKILFQSRSAPEFRFLSNFHVALMEIDGERWMSVEHYYQASKAILGPDRQMIKDAPTPAIAKKYGMTVELRKDWDQVKDDVMLKAVRAKFRQHPDLREKLILTDGYELVEYAPWGDTYWGVNKNLEGQNRLGQILMLVRFELAGEELT